jgi:hypothetical protein
MFLLNAFYKATLPSVEKNTTRTGAILALAAALSTNPAFAAESSNIITPRNIRTDELQLWSGKTTDLIAISVKMNTDGKVYLSPWQAGASYDVSGIVPGFFLYNSDSRPNEKVRPKANLLPDYWQVGPHTDITYVTPKFRNQLIFSLRNEKSLKESSLLIEAVKDGVTTYNPSINGAYRIDSRYTAFKTNQFDFIFFDQQLGNFESFGINAATRPVKEKCKGSGFSFVMICGPDHATLFRAKDGTVVVDNPVKGDFRIVPLKHSNP